MTDDPFKEIAENAKKLAKVLEAIREKGDVGRLGDGIKLLYAIHHLSDNMGRDWGIIRRHTMSQEATTKHIKGFLEDLDDLEKNEHRLVRLVHELSQAVYSHSKTKTLLKGSYRPVYDRLKGLMLSVISIVKLMDDGEKELKQKLSQVEKEFKRRFLYNAEKMIEIYFPKAFKEPAHELN